MSIGTLFDKLVHDPWRDEVGFSDEMARYNEQLFAAKDDKAAIDALSNWLASRFQPCLFGRIAARAELISFCILREPDLLGDRRALQDKIQAARLEWRQQGFLGAKSAFVILATSPRLTTARPDDTVKAIACELCQAYLLRDIQADEIYHDDLMLEKPGTHGTMWRWLAGVNYFGANADKRWWQDHRIPGGIAFSINSVGHLVKSGKMAEGLKRLDELVGGPAESKDNEVVKSLESALDLAMRTIDLAAETVSGKATRLLDLTGSETLPACPVALPKKVQNKDYTKYEGWYHTDITVPSEYFRPDVERPSEIKTTELDFTYLFHDDIDNPDHIRVGKGERVRTDAERKKDHRLHRMVAESVAVKDYEELYKAIRKK